MVERGGIEYGHGVVRAGVDRVRGERWDLQYSAGGAIGERGLLVVCAGAKRQREWAVQHV